MINGRRKLDQSGYQNGERARYQTAFLPAQFHGYGAIRVGLR